MQDQRGNRKEKTGVVVSDKMDKTVVVRVERKMRHPIYGKVVIRGKNYFAHCEGQKPAIGDAVTISETRPLSKLKRWRVVKGESLS